MDFTASSCVILDAKVVNAKPPILECGDGATVVPIHACDRSSLNRVVELCCGIGAFSSVCSALDFSVLAGVDTNSRWESIFRALHPGSSSFLHGGCGDSAVVQKLLSLGGLHSIVLSGVSCQPFSVGGDRRGLKDPRSISLPHTLRTAWLLQAPVVVLECTPEIQNDREVQVMLAEYCKATGCFLFQSVFALQDIWCTKRERWFAVISAGPFGQIRIPPPPMLRDCRLVGYVMPYVVQWPREDLQQIELSLYELNNYYLYAAGGIQKAFLDLKAQLPTLLHSCGNQLYDCRCGCRKALSLSRLASRGLFGTLVPCGGTIRHENQYLQASRYLHPQEMYLLQGGCPDVDFGSDHRLAMAGIGQCVSPLIATWILAHVRVAVLTLVDEPPICPATVLEEHIFKVLDARDEIWPTPMDQADFMPGDHPVKIWDHSTSSMIAFKCQMGSTVDQFLAAERALRRTLLQGAEDMIVDPLVWVGEQKCSFGGTTLNSVLDLSLNKPPVLSRAPDLPCPLCEDQPAVADVEMNVVSPTLPFTVASAPVSSPAPISDVRELVERPCEALMTLVCPRLSSLSSVPTLLNRVLPEAARVQICSNQAEAWADDELRYFLQQTVEGGPTDLKLMYWDPLALTSVVRFANFNLLQELIASVPQEATVLSACVIEGHWYAVCWKCEVDSVKAFTCGHPCNMSLALQKVHQEFCSHRNCPLVPISFRSVPFVTGTCCGALAVAFFRHFVFGVDLPPSAADLSAFHKSLRDIFASKLSPTVPRPWIFGLGIEPWRQKLESLLQDHGVAMADVRDRTATVISKLGEGKVSKAVSSSSPWKDLKWLANQSIPPLQLIQPLELKQAIDKRSRSDQPVGKRSQKAKGKGKGEPAGTKQVDPTGLRIESGLFQCGNGVDLPQLDLTQIGSSASGIVLTSLDAALPYLRSGKQISVGGLGFLLVNCTATEVPTSLIPEPIRVPVVCVANSEPVLLDAVLFQLGAMPVSRRPQSEACSIVTLSSCVVKILVFRDQLDIQWDVFARHPMRHIFSKVPTLVACDDEFCQGHCEAWHPTSECALDSPVMELWAKQWLKLNFSQVQASQAELYTVHLRVPSCLAVQLQTYSGFSGLYLEPKHVDGRQASDMFQVFWMPKHSYQEVLHIRQTTQHVIGIARMGDKYGLRCRAERAETVHASLRPGSSFLPPGRKMVYLLGPLPFGTIRSSLVALLESISWVARPLQPIASGSPAGVMWRIQSVSPPPVSVVPTDKGDVVITRLEDVKQPPPKQTTLVGASRTLDLCTGDASKVAVLDQNGKKSDPLQSFDPWASSSKPTVHGPGPVEELERKLVEAVIAKLPKETMEVDGTSDESIARVEVLERQVQELREGQHGLHAMMVEQGRAHDHQIGCLQQQSNKLEGAVNEHSQSLASFQAQFSHQLAQQENRLDSLFRQQMDKLEDLFSKKARRE